MTWYVRFTAPAFDDPEADVGHEPPPGHEGPVPPGKGLADTLVERLRAAGREVENRWATDYSHAFDVRIGEDRFDGMVYPPEGDARRWAISLEERRGLLQRAMGRSAHPDSLRNLCRGVHEALRGLPSVDDVRWFDAEAWDGVDTPGGDPEPPHAR